MKKAKCVFLNYPDKRGQGGVTCFYASLKEQYAKSKYRIKYFRVGRSYAKGIRGLRIFRLFDSVFRYFVFCVRIFIARPAILHVNPSTDKKSVIRESIFVRIVKIISPNTKVLVHVHGWNNSDVSAFTNNSIVSMFARYLFIKADHVIVLAEKFRSGLRAFVKAENISVVPTTVDTKLIKSEIKSIGYRKYIQVLFLARMTRAKGIFEIVKSIKQLEQYCQNSKLKFLLAGDGPDRKEVFSELEKLQILDYVSIPGYLHGKYKYRALAESSIFLLPTSHGEGCPMALLEAMAAGLAVIATDVGAIGEIIEPGINGIIIPDGNHNSITKAIQYLLTNEQLREKMGENNLSKVKRIADVDVVFNRITQIYESMLKH